MRLIDKWFWDKFTGKQQVVILLATFVAFVAFCNVFYGDESKPASAAEACRRVPTELSDAYDACMDSWSN